MHLEGGTMRGRAKGLNGEEGLNHKHPIILFLKDYILGATQKKVTPHGYDSRYDIPRFSVPFLKLLGDTVSAFLKLPERERAPLLLNTGWEDDSNGVLEGNLTTLITQLINELTTTNRLYQLLFYQKGKRGQASNEERYVMFNHPQAPGPYDTPEGWILAAGLPKATEQENNTVIEGLPAWILGEVGTKGICFDVVVGYLRQNYYVAAGYSENGAKNLLGRLAGQGLLSALAQRPDDFVLNEERCLIPVQAQSEAAAQDVMRALTSPAVEEAAEVMDTNILPLPEAARNIVRLMVTYAEMYLTTDPDNDDPAARVYLVQGNHDVWLVNGYEQPVYASEVLVGTNFFLVIVDMQGGKMTIKYDKPLRLGGM